MLKFIDINQVNPLKTTPKVRSKNFNEIYTRFSREKAEEQSSRCSQCGIPFCQIHCPLQNNIPDWLQLTAEDRLEEAYEISSATNNMPEVCGRICPQDRLCEGNCVIEQSGHRSVTIGSVEKYITDVAWEKGWVKNINVLNEKQNSIGIIGSGPAGLAAAEQLRKKGYQITIYDRYDRPGGLLIYGIPNFKLEKKIVNKKGLKDTVKDFENGRLDAKNKNVIVVGGGDTAMDCVRTAVRQGAQSVKCLYRRDQKNMPGSQREVQNAIEEGIDFNWLTLPVEYLGDNKIEKTKIVRMHLGSSDESGRRSSQIISGSEENLETDLIIEALGFEPEDLPKMFSKKDLAVTQWGTIKINYKNMMTSMEGVFAAGDIVRGASLVVWGIKDGRDAAEYIHNFINEKEIKKYSKNELIKKKLSHD